MKLPNQLNHKILETYFSDPVEFEVRYIYGLKKKEPYKKFVKKINAVDDECYDDSIFWHYQKQRVQNILPKQLFNREITVPFGEYELTQRIDHFYDNAVVCISPYGPPTQKAIKNLESLQLVLCGYCVEQQDQTVLDRLEYWHLKGYKDIIEKVIYPRSLIDEVMGRLKEKLIINDAQRVIVSS